MNELTAFQRDALYVIAGHDEPHGLMIKNELDEYYGEDINHGRLYPNLNTLVDKGLVNKGSKDRRTNYYELTEAGEELIESREEFLDELLESSATPQL